MKLGLTLALATASTGCLATAHGQVRGGMVVYSDPPPARVVVVDENPGYVWVDGQWVWVNNQWVWNDGYWIPERQGYVYVNGYWETRGHNRVWREPYWRRGNGGYVRANGVYVAPRVRGSVEVHDHSSYGGGVRARPAPAPARIQVNDHSRDGGRVIIRDHGKRR